MYKIVGLGLTDEIIGKILEVELATDSDGLERSFHICELRDELYPTTECVGVKCEISGTPRCLKGHAVASVHTHYNAPDTASAGDLLAILHEALANLPGIGCRTGTDKLRCERVIVPQDAISPTYMKAVREYNESVYPLYKEWDRTGKMPADGRWEAHERIRNEAMPLFDTALTDTQLMEVALKVKVPETYDVGRMMQLALKHNIPMYGSNDVLARRLREAGVL